MDKLLEILLALFGNYFNLTDLLAKIAAKLLEGVQDSSGCKEYFLQLLRTGTLDDKFKENPIGVICCSLHVLLALADKYDVHVHGKHVALMDDGPWIGDLAESLEVTAPKAGLEFLIPILIEQVVKILKKLIDEWLNK